MSSASTPGGFSTSLLGGSIGKSLGKSFSTSNLRKAYDADGESILAPGAFSTNSSRFSHQGSMKKLTIDRTLRSDLFGASTAPALPSTERHEPRVSSSLKKKVSFDASTSGGSASDNVPNGVPEASGAITNGVTNGELSPTPTAQEQGFLRPSSRVNLFNGKVSGGRRSLGAHSSEMSQVKGNELAIVHENGSLEEPEEDVEVPADVDLSDPEPGEYWTKPPMHELKKMSREQLKRVDGFEVGRDGCGKCQFLAPVDLTTVDLDNFFGNIAHIALRTCTIYENDAMKPPEGMGLNVPSRIRLYNSWPRHRFTKEPTRETSGQNFDKHIQRLRVVRNTRFIGYDKPTGTWLFEVPHFTTYALDYEDESDANPLESSALSGLGNDPPTPTPFAKKSRPGSTPGPSRSELPESSMLTNSFVQPSSEPDDTFEFKKRRVPGGFDEAPIIDDEPEMEVVQQNGEPFLAERLAASPSEPEEDEPSELNGEDVADERLVAVRNTEDEDQEMTVDMVGSFPEEEEPGVTLENGSHNQPTPRKSILTLRDNWTEQLQRTISPRKRDRQALKDGQALLFHDGELNRLGAHATKEQNVASGEITSSIDLMKSLFGKEEMRKSTKASGKQGAKKGFQV